MKSLSKTKLGLLLALLASQSFAATSTFQSGLGVADVVNQISFTDVLSAVFSIGVVVIGVDMAQIAYFKVRRLVKGST